MAEGTRDRFLRHRKTAQNIREGDESRLFDPFGETAYPYEQTFRRLLVDIKVESFANLIDQRFAKTGNPQIVLDLMAPPASFLNKLVPLPSFGAGIAVTLGKEGDKGVMTTVSGKEIYAVNGDILQRKTWQSIDRGLEEIHARNNQFDVIVCRPEEPFVGGDVEKDFLFEDLPLLSVVLQRAWDRLTPDEGMLFTQLPKIEKSYMPYVSWLDHLPTIARQYGVDISIDFTTEREPILRIIKMTGSLSDFPNILLKESLSYVNEAGKESKLYPPANSYLKEKYKTLLSGYLAEDGTPESSTLLACEIAKLLLEGGEKPSLLSVKGELLSDGVNSKPVVPLIYKGNVEWEGHVVCAIGDIVLDPMIGAPMRIINYRKDIFTTPVVLEEVVPPEFMEEFIKGEK